MHAAIANDGIVIARECATLDHPTTKRVIASSAVEAKLARARRAVEALAEDDLDRRIAGFTRTATIAFATAAVLARSLVPKACKDRERREAHVRDCARGRKD